MGAIAIKPEDRLAAMGLVLPPAPIPAGQYRPARRAGAMLYLSGQGPRQLDGAFVAGRVGLDMSLEVARNAARDVALQLLSIAKAELGDLSQISAVAHVSGLIYAAPGFIDHAAVLDGCSDLLIAVLGEAGYHSRSVAGVGSMPFNMVMQIVATMHCVSSGEQA